MSKTLSINFENKTYLLEYTRDTVRLMEQSGFIGDDLFVKPMTMLPQLFQGAFLAHHRGMKRKDLDRMLDTIPNRSELFVKLREMYLEPISALMEEPEEAEGNASWTASF